VGVEKNWEKSFQMFQAAALQNLQEGQTNLALAYVCTYFVL
jgi:TPR repeat protein